ncbi:hypothetical protein Fmac_003789 [Flemingia macrophylla]|uniref:Endonuclease/exonuclease/phosphatase domain-containing protein n=1 Tax=Flemingia macrophylla TaxID=520843 RepID=A0ABD1N347_9FABA
MACNSFSCSSWLILSSTSAHAKRLPIASQIQWHSDSYTRKNLHHAPQIQRHWVQASDQSLLSPERFSVASYNILGVRNASQHSDLYLNVPSRYINWDRRKRVICDELFGWDPDIICLQRRTGDTVDGCAMFWKADKFRLLEGEGIQFKDVGLRDNVAQLSVFEIRFLSSRAQYLSGKWGKTPIVLAGDFNSTPQLNIMLYDRKELSGQKRCRPAQVLGENKETVAPIVTLDSLFKFWTDEEVKIATGDSESHLAVHPLKLNSSYSDGIVPTRVLDTVPISDLVRAGGLPCKQEVAVAVACSKGKERHVYPPMRELTRSIVSQ